MANRRFIDFPIASTVGDNDIVLIWQDGANKQTTKATILSGLPENLEDLNDVVISGLTNGQILRYDSVTNKWENTDQGNLDLNDLNDVSIVSPSNGQVLVYNSSTSKWENSSGGFVPYVGAVTTVDLGAQGLRAGYVRFDTSVASVPDEQGLMYWDASRSTAALIMNGTLQHIGQDTFFYVKNSSGSNIPKGTCVRFAGTDGASGHLLVAPFLANGSVPSSYFMGVTAEAIANGSFGQVMHFGELEGINTSGFTAGALLYASTTVAGGFQTTVPVAPNNIVLVAAAVNSKNNGAIIVRPQIGSNINNDEGVKITSPTTGDLLQLQAGGLWENKTLAQVIGSAYVPSTRTITINGVTQDLSANRTYNVGTVTSVGLSSATSGVTIGSTPVTTSGTITLAIATASGSQNGLLSSTDWTTFNNKQNALGYVPVPETRTITINGNTFDLSTDRSWSVGDMLLNTYQVITGAKVFGTNRLIMDGEGTAQSTSLSNTQQSNSALTSYNSFGFNGSNNIYFNKGTTANGGIFAFSNTATRTYTLKDASGTLAFTSDIPANPVGGTGTTNYLPKFTGSTTIGNSAIIDDGTSVNVISRTLTITRGNYSAFGFEINQQSTFAFGSTNGKRIAIITDATAADNGLQFGYDTVDKTGIIAGSATSAGAGIDFYTFNGSAWGNRARVTASGNLLVGTTSDNGARLQVSGYGTFAVLGNNTRAISVIGGTTAKAYLGHGFGSLFIQNNNYFNGSSYVFDDTSVGSSTITMGESIAFQTGAANTNPSTKVTITNSGNVGIGITPNARLHVNANDGLNEGIAAAIIRQGGSSGNNGIVVDVTNNPGIYVADFRIANSSVARITNTANLLVGTTTDNGARLQVSGGITALNSLVVTSSSNAALIASTNSTTGFSYLDFINSGASGRNYQIGVAGNGASSGYANNLYFDLVGVANIMTLTSGRNVLIGTQTDNGARLQVSGAIFTSLSNGVIIVRDNGTSQVEVNVRHTSTRDGVVSFTQDGVADRWAIGTKPSDGTLYFSANFNLSTPRLSITSSGNVGIGTSSPSYRLVVNSGTDGISAGVAGSTYGIRFDNGGTFSSGMSTIHGVDSTLIGSYQPIMLNGLDVRFGTSATERMRITSGGNVLIGTTTDVGEKLHVNGSGVFTSFLRAEFLTGENNNSSSAVIQGWNKATSGDNKFIEFYTEGGGGTLRGSIDFNRGAGLTRYNTTSDYRLKTELEDFNANDIIKNLKPKKYRMLNASEKMIGFIAHELQEFYPQAVSGKKDQVNESGLPIYQGIDYSQLTGLLVKAIQELKQEIDTLKN